MVLALAQSKRNNFRPEKEVDMLRALTSNEFELTKEEVADSFTTALATADKMLNNVPHGLKEILWVMVSSLKFIFSLLPQPLDIRFDRRVLRSDKNAHIFSDYSPWQAMEVHT